MSILENGRNLGLEGEELRQYCFSRMADAALDRAIQYEGMAKERRAEGATKLARWYEDQVYLALKNAEAFERRANAVL
jgi:hypothetical protein